MLGMAGASAITKFPADENTDAYYRGAQIPNCGS